MRAGDVGMKCPNCGAENPDGETHCQKCANPLESIRKAPLKRNTVIAASASLIVLSVLVISVLVLASVPEFDHSAKIPTNGSFTYRVLALKGDNIAFSWDASHSVAFVLRYPDGDVAFATGGESFSRTILVSSTGEYELQWFNDREFSVRMSFDASSSTLDNIRSPLLTEITWLVALVVILITVLMTIIVFAVRHSGLFRQGQ
jgi:hypothetical protein